MNERELFVAKVKLVGVLVLAAVCTVVIVMVRP